MPLIENQSFSSTPQASMTPYQKMEFQKNLASKIQLNDATVEEVGSVNSDMIEMSDMSPPTSEKENIEVAEDNPSTENQPNGGGESQALGDGANEVEGDIIVEESAIESETISKDQEIEVNKNSGIEEGAEDSSTSEISDQTN